MPDVFTQRWCEIEASDRFSAALDAIFFEASHTKSFDTDASRAVFRRRWLGRYLDMRPDLAHLLFQGDTAVPEALIGYVVGAHEDPARTSRYDDIGYFHLLSDVTRRFPAHLHINLHRDYRGRGLGGLLISRFVADVAAAGLPGVHVVTGAGLRNVGFYRQNGFDFVHRFVWNDKDLAFLGRTVADPSAGRGVD